MTLVYQCDVFKKQGAIAIGIVVEARLWWHWRDCAVTVPGERGIMHGDEIVLWLHHPAGDGTKPTNSPVGIEIFALIVAGWKSLWRIAQKNNKSNC